MRAFKKVCARIDQIKLATLGKEGSRTYEDFNELMSKGGTLNNVKVSNELQQSVGKVCLKTMEQASLIVGRVDSLLSANKDGGNLKRLADIEWKSVLCNGWETPDGRLHLGLLRTCESRARKAKAAKSIKEYGFEDFYSTPQSQPSIDSGAAVADGNEDGADSMPSWDDIDGHIEL